MQYNISDSQALFWYSVPIILEMASLETLCVNRQFGLNSLFTTQFYKYAFQKPISLYRIKMMIIIVIIIIITIIIKFPRPGNTGLMSSMA